MLREYFLTASDTELWQQFLPPDRSVFGSLGYARICEALRGVVARLHVIESETGFISHPMLLRPLTDLPFEINATGKWDVTTPEYTGPLFHGDIGESPETLRGVRRELMRREGIVAEFAHLYPWSNGPELLGEGTTYNRDIIWVDVTLPPDQIVQKSLEHACRRNIKKAQGEGVTVFASASNEHIREHFRIYSATMRRNNALDSYAFSLEYFLAFRDQLPNNARFVFAEYRGQIVASFLYVYDQENVYYFLGGADAEFSHVRPSNLMIWEMIRWAHDSGKKRLILGGGYAPDDGIFRFKSGFSKLRQPFFIYKQVHLEQDYAKLDARSREFNSVRNEDVSYFPSYRYVKAR
jgi:hypothetical protein